MLLLLIPGTGMGGTATVVVGVPVERRNSTDDAGAIVVETLSDVTGLKAWVDYVPVFEVSDVSGKQWRVDDNGFIPVVEEA